MNAEPAKTSSRPVTAAKSISSTFRPSDLASFPRLRARLFPDPLNRSGTLDDPGGTDEGASRASRGAVKAGAGHHQRAIGGEKLGIRFSGPEAGQAAVQHGHAHAVGAHGPARRDYRARLPLGVFGLGVGSQSLFIRASRNGAGAYDRQQGRGRLSAGRRARKAPSDDGSLGAMVRAEGGECTAVCQAGGGGLDAHYRRSLWKMSFGMELRTPFSG